MKSARQLVDALRIEQPPNKSLGQHFLIDDDILERIITHANLNESDHVLEIGPSPGTLTQVLMQNCGKVTAIEFDEGACKHLDYEFKSQINEGKLDLISGDALTEKWPEKIDAVVANIPYQISSPLIEKLTQFLRNSRFSGPRICVLMVQEEFAMRLVMPEWPDHSSLGMCAKMDWSSELLDHIPPHHFSPSPLVHSRLVRMSPCEWEYDIDKRLVKTLIQSAFSERRKKIRTSLKSVPKRISRVPGWHAKRWKDAYVELRDEEIMEHRPEELEFEDWIDLAMDFQDGLIID